MPGRARGNQQEAEVKIEGKVEVRAWASLKKLLQGWRTSSAIKFTGSGPSSAIKFTGLVLSTASGGSQLLHEF